MIQTRRSIAGLLLGVLVSGSPVLAAGGPYFTNLRRGLFYPAYLPRDTPAIAAALGLTDQEEILVETIIDRYVAQYQQEAEAVQLELETATGDVRPSWRIWPSDGKSADWLRRPCGPRAIPGISRD